MFGDSGEVIIPYMYCIHKKQEYMHTNIFLQVIVT